MAVLSVDLANKSYADIGAVILRHERDHIRAEQLRVAFTGAPSPDALADSLSAYCEEAAIQVLLLDGPQGWMASATGHVYCRQCERELNTPAKTGLPGSVKPANYLGWVTFSIALFDALTSRGWERLSSLGSPIMPKTKVLIESFPLSAWRALNLTPLPAKRKCTQKDLDGCFTALKAIAQLQMPFVPNHDELQALIAGFAGLAVECNDWRRCVAVGLPPTIDAGYWREGFIVNPTRAVFDSVDASVVRTDGQSACERPEPAKVKGASSQGSAGREVDVLGNRNGEPGDEVIAEIVRRVLAVSRPDRIILFGSAATGRMNRDSDVDLLVLEREVADARRDIVRIRAALAGLPFPFDIVVMSRDRFEETRNVIGGLAWPAARYGRVIYEAA